MPAIRAINDAMADLEQLYPDAIPTARRELDAIAAIDTELAGLGPEQLQAPIETRRKALKESCRNIQWLRLKVLDCRDGGPLDQYGTVTFEARWRDRDRREGVLRECSRFGRGESGEWLYLEALSLGNVPAG